MLIACAFSSETEKQPRLSDATWHLSQGHVFSMLNIIHSHHCFSIFRSVVRLHSEASFFRMIVHFRSSCISIKGVPTENSTFNSLMMIHLLFSLLQSLNSPYSLHLTVLCLLGEWNLLK